jgi:hypothetical protein
MCHQCGGWTGGPGVIRYLCPAHYSQVREYIEGLKPVFPKMPRGGELPYNAVCHRIVVARDDGVYAIVGDYGTQTRAWLLHDDAADALYSYMRAERGE